MSPKIQKWSVRILLLSLFLFALLRPFVTYRAMLGALVIWAIAIYVLRPRARPSIPSITDRTPGSQSL
jgi:hypothetical protein